jgi:hypothetical protein
MEEICMKISFSTLACPEYSWSDIYSMAKDIGFNGIEIRGLGNDIFAVNAQPFSDNPPHGNGHHTHAGKMRGKQFPSPVHHSSTSSHRTFRLSSAQGKATESNR